MSARTVVMVLDRDDPQRGEITILSATHEAARLAEDLIESGVEIDRIRVFDATELSMKVEHKPVVSLGDHSGEDSPPLSAEPSEETEPVPVFAGEPQGEADAEESLVQNGVRFSSLFKSDDL